MSRKSALAQPASATHPARPVAYSYMRFSTGEQGDGDSIRRQTALREGWLKRNPDVVLDDKLKMTDRGRSAFKGRHRSDTAALGRFLDEIKAGRVPRGSFLIIENLDRLSREDERTALRLWLDILDAGVNIVQLNPETIFRHERSDMSDIIRAIIELSRGHSESLQKSQRTQANWDVMRANAREKKSRVRRSDHVVTTHITRRLPGWIREVDGRLELIPDRASVVRNIFELACAGYGMTGIVRKLTEAETPAFGDREKTDNGRTRKRAGEYYGCGEWRTSYVRSILSDRRAIGEFQPRDSSGRAAGEPIPGYYPPAVAEADFYKARATIDGRRNKPGRTGKNVANLFGGLLVNWRDGQSYYAATRSDNGCVSRVLLNRTSIEGKSKALTFPYAAFEDALLGQLKEVEPGDVLPKPGAERDELKVLRGELAWLRERKVALAAELLKGDVSAVADALRQLEARESVLVARLGPLEDETVVPLHDTFETAQSLAELLASATDRTDARVRLKATLRRVIDRIDVLVTRHKRDRIAIVRVTFRKGGVRSYVIWLRPPRGNQSYHAAGRWWCRSFASLGFEIGGKILTDATLPDALANRLKRYAAGLDAGVDGKWRCACGCAYNAYGVFGDDESFAPLTREQVGEIRISGPGAKDLRRRITGDTARNACPACHATPQVPDDVTTGEVA